MDGWSNRLQPDHVLTQSMQGGKQKQNNPPKTHTTASPNYKTYQQFGKLQNRLRREAKFSAFTFVHKPVLKTKNKKTQKITSRAFL